MDNIQSPQINVLYAATVQTNVPELCMFRDVFSVYAAAAFPQRTKLTVLFTPGTCKSAN